MESPSTSAFPPPLAPAAPPAPAPSPLSRSAIGNLPTSYISYGTGSLSQSLLMGSNGSNDADTVSSPSLRTCHRPADSEPDVDELLLPVFLCLSSLTRYECSAKLTTAVDSSSGRLETSWTTYVSPFFPLPSFLATLVRALPLKANLPLFIIISPSMKKPTQFYHQPTPQTPSTLSS
jgi:hypothetical protein